jgi:sulfur relay (sulfurtransferase) DsrC/TusE family protein
MSLCKFLGTIFIINGNPYVRPPDEVLQIIFKQADKETSPVPIRGKINGAKFEQSLVRYQGDWRLYVNIIMANAAGIKFSKSISEIVGTVATFEIEFNPTPPVYKMVTFLQKSLNSNPTAKDNWEKLPPSRQKEILRYFSWLKSDESKQRNLKKVIEALMGKEVRFMARSWKDGK